MGRTSASSKSLFLFWTVHGPFSLFLRSEKEKMGGCIAPAIIMAKSPPPVRARNIQDWGSPNHPPFHMEHLPPQHLGKPVILTAGDEHLSPGNPVEHKLLPLGIQLTEHIVQ